MIKRIQVRRGTLAEWTTANPVLYSGEIGFEKDTGYYRVGDGVTAFLSLPKNVPSTRTINGVDLSANRSLDDIGAASVRIIKTTNFTASINGRYTVNGTVTVTDPAGTVAGQIYSVLCGSGTATIGGVAYLPSRVEIVRYYNGSSWSTLAPVLSDSATFGANLSVNGNTTLGDASGDSVTVNAGTVTAPNATGTGSTALANVGTLDARYWGAATAKLASPFSPTNNTLTNLTGFSATIVSGGVYEFKIGITADVAINGVSSGGLKYQIAGITLSQQNFIATDSAVNGGIRVQRNSASANIANNVAAADYSSANWTGGVIHTCQGYFTASSSGTMTLQAAQNTTSAQATNFQANNCWWIVRRIA